MSGNAEALSPTACGRSPLAEGAKALREKAAGRACPPPTKQQPRYRAIAANPALISPLCGQLPPMGKPL